MFSGSVHECQGFCPPRGGVMLLRVEGTLTHRRTPGLAAVNGTAGAFVCSPQEASAVSWLGPPRLQLLGQVEVLF